jgi:Zn-dependent M28 family amino/carboxypeptidase
MLFRAPRALPAPGVTTSALASRLKHHVRELAGRIGSRHVGRPAALEQARMYVESVLRENGYTVELQSFAAGGGIVSNIEAHHGSPPERIIVVGAHYDTVPGTPGANDNASGVAALLELARVTRRSAGDTGCVFVAFVNEEPPWFQTPSMGSVVYATRAKQRRDRIVGMLSLETMGYYSEEPRSQQYPAPFHLFFPRTGNFLAAVSNFRSTPLLREFSRAFRRATPLPLVGSPAPEGIAGVGWSDHWAFWQQGYPALMVTDTAPFRYADYHRVSDTPDKLDYVRLAYAVEGIAAALRTLSSGQ